MLQRKSTRRRAPAIHRISSAVVALLSQSASNVLASPHWETASPAAKEQNIAIAVCLPGEEIVCVGFGCRDAYGFDFVEMIVGDWLEGATRLSAGGHMALLTMNAD